MKRYQLIIPVLFISALEMVAQKSTNPYSNLLMAYNLPSTELSSTNSTVRIPNGNDDKLIFVNCWIKPLDQFINSSFPEYTSVLNEQGNAMFFTSRRPENVGNKRTIDKTYKAEDIYFSSKNAQGKWSPATPVVGKVNSNKNEAITWVSGDGKKMILCQNEDLFESNLVNGVWAKPVPMEIINSMYRETHASYSPDGNAIFFTTDDPSLATVGGLDICMVRKDAGSGSWGIPTLVENINSPLNEEGPSLSADGKTLYFSSQGFSTMGGYDIFKSNIGANYSAANPQNIGFPVNTEGNEPFISFTDGGKRAFLSSDRGDRKEQNIYEVTFLDYIKVPLLVEVYDQDTKQLINSEVTLMNVKKGSKNIYLDNITPGVFAADKLDLDAHFSVQVSANNYDNQELLISTANLGDFNPDSFKLVQKVYLKAKKLDEFMHEDLLTKLVHFDFGKANLNDASLNSMGKIKELLLVNPSAHIVIHAHTDNKGSNVVNLKLSNLRANAVANWFAQNGISTSRIVVKAYGEDKPLVDNATDNNRAKNRRAEIEILY